MREKGVKKTVITELFQACEKSGCFEFDNEFVKKICKKEAFKNQFDATKCDNSNNLPDILRKKDYFVLHLGNGKHKFVKGIQRGYHKFEPIPDRNQYQWKYRKSLLNEYDTSESNILSVALNQRILHDFLYEDIVASPKAYNSRRTKMTCSFHIGTERIEAENLQIEIDFTLEHSGKVTVIEGKNGFPADFAVYQLFNPFKYFAELKTKSVLSMKEISCCYVLRDKAAKGSLLRLYNYTFDDADDMTSIHLAAAAQYELIKR